MNYPPQATGVPGPGMQGYHPYGVPGWGPYYGAGYAAPPPMPGTARATRVFMYIFGALGLLLAAVFIAFVTLPQTSAYLPEIAGDRGYGAAYASELFVGAALVTGLYGFASVALAALMSLRSVTVYWCVIVFQAIALLWSLVGWVGEGSGGLMIIIAILLLGFMGNRVTLSYYEYGRVLRQTGA